LQSNEFKTTNRSKNKGNLGNFHGIDKIPSQSIFHNHFNIQRIMIQFGLHFFMIVAGLFKIISST